MSLEDQLHDYFKEYDDKGFVIAINGEWGIGKTEFWKRFIEEKCKEERDNAVHWPKVGPHNFYINKPYAYVSLFGVDSLSALKIQIATSLSGDFSKNTKAYISQKIKKGFLFLKELRGTYEGLSLTSPRLVEEIIFYGVKDAIICLDDFERLSKNLDIKDVMGLINFLKVENNCQIVLIMHDDQLKNDTYKGYKEKVFDEQLTIPSVLPLLQGMTYKNDRHKEIFIKFYECLEVNNFRFYKKVERLYKRFEKYVPEPHSEFISDLILTYIFEGVFAADFPDVGYNWGDGLKISSYFNKDKLSKEDDKLKIVLKNFYKFRIYSFYGDEWVDLLKEWLDVGFFDEIVLKKLIEREEYSQINSDNKSRLDELVDQFYSLKIDDDYVSRLYECIVKVASSESIQNLDSYCGFLEVFGNSDLLNRLEEIVKSNLRDRFFDDPIFFTKRISKFPIDKENRFYSFVEKIIKENESIISTSLADAVDAFISLSFGKQHILAINHSNKKDWEKFIFEDFKSGPMMSAITILKDVNDFPIQSDKKNKIMDWVKEILEEKYPDGTEFEGYRKFLISQLDTLGK